MAATLVLPNGIVDQIQWAARNPLETAGVLLASIVEGDRGELRILAREIHWVDDSAYARREYNGLSIASHGYVPALGRGVGANPDDARLRAAVGTVLVGFAKEVNAALRPAPTAPAIGEPACPADVLFELIQDLVEPDQMFKPLVTHIQTNVLSRLLLFSQREFQVLMFKRRCHAPRKGGSIPYIADLMGVCAPPSLHGSTCTDYGSR